MPRRLACCVALVLSCFASHCQHSKPRTEEPLPATAQLRIERYFDARTQLLGNTRAEIVKNLGKPKLERTENDLKKANELTAEDARLVRGHGVENEIFEWAYEGLLLKILKVNSPPYREFIFYITVTSDRYRMPWNLNVGSPRQEVKRILGDPSKFEALKDSYRVVHSGNPSGYEDQVTLTYHDGRIIQICFWLYID
jgi:hypothetical protein